MWTQDRFSWKSSLIEIPERQVVPRPLQKPHPPLWQTCTSPESFEMAGQLGVGALATTLLSPLDSLRTLLEHYELGLSQCEPAGSFVNAKRSVFTFMHCAETREQAIASRAGEAALWFVNAAPHVFHVPRSLWIDAIRGDLASNDPRASAALEANADPLVDDDPNDPVPVIRLLNRQLHGQPLDPEEVYEVLDPLDSVVIGDPDTCQRKLERYAALGIDRLMCLMQFGALPQEDILHSIRISGEALIPKLDSMAPSA
jgi:alkanesulfonate monooxygenase SsuD/methylene tetrahydromethanopterin reductase-like flavin-dependent oxidoreductase (luciferase family)